MIRRTPLLRCLCLLAALPAGPTATTGAEPGPTRLEYRFRAGERLDMRVAHRALTETTVGATSQSTETATDSRKRWTVIAVDPEGRATLEHSVDDVTMTSRPRDWGEIRWSSAGTEPAPPGYEQVQASLGVPLSRMACSQMASMRANRSGDTPAF